MRDLANDCEDVGLAIGVQIFAAYCQFKFKKIPEHKQILKIQEIANQYIGVMSLDTVTAAAVKDDRDDSKAASHKRQLGAHIKANFLPAKWVKSRIEKGTKDMAGMVIGAGINGSVQELVSQVIGSSIDGSKTLLWKPFTAYADDLPVLIGEGTGMFQTLGVECDPIQGERVEVYTGLPSLAAFKKSIVHKPGAESSFFVGSMVGFTSYWFDMGLNISGMWLGYSGDANVSNPGKFQRGIHFKHLATKSEAISILPHPPFSDNVMAWMRRQTRIRVPPRALVLTPEGVAKHPVENATINELVTFTASMNRKRTVQQDAVPIYMQPHQLVPDVVNALKRDIQRDSKVTGMSYVCENFTDWMQVYRVGIYANAK